MSIHLSQPATDPDGLDDVRGLWMELHRHHREVADYRDLVEDMEESWQRRRDWYRRLLDEDAAYITASEDGRPVGYAMVTITPGADDTFASAGGGIAEVVTLVVAAAHRAGGVGTALLAAAEAYARERGADTVRIAVMSGNDRAGAFYAAHGYAVAEQVLYRRL